MHPVPAAGEPAPDFQLEDSERRVQTLSRLAADRPLVLVFTRGAESAECVRQLIDYRNSTRQFERAGVRIVGVTPDEPTTSGYLKLERGIAFPLLSDPELRVFRAWGLIGMDGQIRPATFVVDRDGIVRTRAVAQRPEAERMLAFVKRVGTARRARSKAGPFGRVAAFVGRSGAALRHALRIPGLAR
jgi:peroxiredoxin Q/BCP